MHICISKLTSVGSDDGLSPGRRAAIILSNAGILLIGPLGLISVVSSVGNDHVMTKSVFIDRNRSKQILASYEDFSWYQAALRTPLSICQSVCPSLHLSELFSQCFSHHIILKLWVITIDKTDVLAKGQGQRSKVNVTEVKTNFAIISAFRDRNSTWNSQMAMKWCTKQKRWPIGFFRLSVKF